MEKQLSLELNKVELGWKGKVSDISLRITIKGKIEILKLKEVAVFALRSQFSELQMHVLVQSGNIALASVTQRFSSLFAESKESFLRNFELLIPVNVLKILVPGINSAKVVKFQLIGRIGKFQETEKNAVVESVQEKVEEKEEKSFNEENDKTEEFLKIEEDSKTEENSKTHEKNEENLEENSKLEEKNEENSKTEELKETIEKNDYQETTLDKDYENITNIVQYEEILPKDQEISEKESISDTNNKILIEQSENSIINQDLESSQSFQNSKLSSLPLESTSLKSVCSYIEKIKKSEFYLRSINELLASLRSEMGGTFQKFIQDSIRRDSKAAPSRKLTNTSLVSQRRAESPRKTETSQISFVGKSDDNIEIPSSFDLVIEKLSSKNFFQILNIIVSLLGKITYYETGEQETKELIQSQKVQEYQLDELKKFFENSQKNLFEAFDIAENLKKSLKEKISCKKLELKGLYDKKAVVLHEKLVLAEKLEGAKENNKKIKAEADPGGKIGEIIELRKKIDIVEQERTDIEEAFKEFSNKEKNEYCSITAEQIRVAELKASALRTIKEKSLENDSLIRENQRLSNEISKLSGLVQVSQEFLQVLQENQERVTNLKENTSALSSNLLNLKLDKENANKTHNSHLSALENQRTSYEISEVSLEKELKMTSEASSKQNSECIKSTSYISDLEATITLNKDLEAKFESLKWKLSHNREIKEQVIYELFYFSDMIFSITQTFLHQSRISHKINAIVEEKDFDLQAMRESLAHFKLKNPVYQPVKGDVIDKALGDYLNSRNTVLPLPFVRENAGIYYFGTRKVNVSYERNKLTVKVGGGFLPIDEFIENYIEIELEKFEKRHQDLSPHMKKFMAKWVGGITANPDASKERIKEALVLAAKEHKYTPGYAIKEITPKKPECFEEIRVDTPVIGED